MTTKAVHGELRMFGPVDSPRERLCVRLIQEMLLKLQQKAGVMPPGVIVAFQWRGENGGTKVFTAAFDAESYQDVSLGVYQEIVSALQKGGEAVEVGALPDDEEGGSGAPPNVQ